MIDHVGIQVTDVAAAARVYLTALGPLGLVEALRHEPEWGLVVGFADATAPHHPYFWISPGTATDPRHESHLAFGAPDRLSVDAVAAAAVEAGLEILHAPRVWPEYHPSYYAVFFRDLDGNNVEAVCQRPVEA